MILAGLRFGFDSPLGFWAFILLGGLGFDFPSNAHLFHRVAAHHFKVYICGSRNRITILNPDKIDFFTKCFFFGSSIRQQS